MHVQPLASTVSDNFFYLLTDGDDAILVDPIDPAVAIDAVRRSGAARTRILVTHGHPDHVGGNDEVKAALDTPVLAPANAATFPVPHDQGLSHGDTVRLGNTGLAVLHAPGHTDGHLVFHADGHLVSGDVFFVAGAGNCRFGGDPAELYRTFHDRLASLPDSTTFLPGHDYARKNLEFCLEVEPGNQGARDLLDRIANHRREDGPVLTTLGQERAYNPFHRVRDAALQQHLANRYPDATDPAVADPGERAFRTLRTLRDSF